MSGEITIHSRLYRKRRKPLWQRYWQRLTAAQQEKVKSVAWAASFHFFLIAILAAIGLATPEIVTIDLDLSFAEPDAIESFTMLAELDADEMLAEVEELAEPDLVAEELLMELSELGELDLALEPAAPTPSEPIDLSQATASSALDAVEVEPSLVAETNRRVTAAGGRLDGPIRISLMFDGDDDIDLHVQYQEIGRAATMRGLNNSRYIFFRSPRTEHAELDVDANASVVDPEPCENIIFKTVPPKAKYIVGIHHYRARGFLQPTPYVLVVKCGEQTKVFKGTISPRDGLIQICQFNFSI